MILTCHHQFPLTDSASQPPQSIFRALFTGSLTCNPSCKGFAVLCGLFVFFCLHRVSFQSWTHKHSKLVVALIRKLAFGNRPYPWGKPSNFRHLQQVCFSMLAFPHLREACSDIADRSTELSPQEENVAIFNKTTSNGAHWSEVKLSAGLHCL